MRDKFPWRLFRRMPHAAPAEKVTQLEKDFQDVFQTQQGARVLAEILHMSEMFQVVAPGASEQDLRIIEGRRELALMIFERAGYLANKLPITMVKDDLQHAIKDGNDEHDPSSSTPSTSSARDPVFGKY